MKQHQATLTITTRRGLTDITDAVRRVVAASGLESGLATVFLRHTSASLVRRTPTRASCTISRRS